MNLPGYMVTVCTTELVEDIKMIKDICMYHYNDQKYKRTLKKQQKKLRKKMDAQKTYESWKFYAQQYDNLPKNKEWKKKTQSKDYDYKYILKIRDQLKEARITHNDERIIHILRSHCYRNIANLMNKPLYSKLYCSTKVLIEQFMEEIKKCAQQILTSRKLPQQVKIEFFVEQKHALGRTALIVSGGGLLSIYSFGVIQALVEHDMLPKIISGSSGGSIVSALVCSQTDQYLKEKLCKKGAINWDPFYNLDQTLFPTIVRRTKHFLNKGVLLDMKRVEEFIRCNIGDLTFQEAFDRTGRILNITVTGKDQHSIQNKLLNYITAPNVIIWSAVGCSCSIPLIYGSTKLMCKDENGNIIEYLSNTEFVDGSIGGDLPMLKLAELFNTTNFIVSQTNPFILPFIDRGEKRDTNKYKRGMYRFMELFKNLFLNEARHRLLQLSQLGLVPHKINQIFHLLEQTYSGNVTIYPKPSIKDYLDVLKYPANEAQSDYCRQHGYEKSFDKIYQIKMTTFYERIIENGYKLVLEQARNQQNTPMYMQVMEEGGDCQIQIEQKAENGHINSQLILNDFQKDNVELLYQNQHNQNQQKQQRSSQKVLRTGMSEVFNMNNSGGSRRRDSFLDDSDIGNDFVDDDDDNDEEKITKGFTRNGQRNISFTIPRSKSKEFLDNILQLSEIEKSNQKIEAKQEKEQKKKNK